MRNAFETGTKAVACDLSSISVSPFYAMKSTTVSIVDHRLCLSPSGVILRFCLSLCCLITPFATSIGDDADEDDDDDAITQSESEYGVTWTIETELIRTDNPAETTAHDHFSEVTVDTSIQWQGPLQNVGTGFIDLSFVAERLEEPLQKTASDSFLELNELWLETELPGISSTLRFGLQEFADERGWWWDDEIVGVRWFGSNAFGWEYSVAALASTDDFNNRDEPFDPEQQDLYYLLMEGHRPFGNNSYLSLYGLQNTDRSGMPAVGSIITPALEDEIDASLFHAGLGLRRHIDIGDLGELTLRGDLAILNGHERRVVFSDDEESNEEEIDSTDEDDLEADVSEETNSDASDEEAASLQVSGQRKINIDAWAVDLGVGWQLPVGPEPLIELGLAVGSGTAAQNPESSKTFRQTGLHDNGLDSGTYGNVFEPELSNLQVLSLSASLPLSEDGEISVYHHRFLKMHYADAIAENELDIDTEATSANIGNETGVYLLYEVFDNAEVVIALSQFRVADAYRGSGSDTINRYSIEFTYEF